MVGAAEAQPCLPYGGKVPYQFSLVRYGNLFVYIDLDET